MTATIINDIYNQKPLLLLQAIATIDCATSILTLTPTLKILARGSNFKL